MARLELERRPDWRAAHARVDAEDQRYKRELGLLLPSLDANAAYGYYEAAGASAPGWTGTLSVSFPFFDHLAQWSSAKAQSYARTTAELNLEQTARDARSQWDAAQHSFDAALATALSREKTLGLSRRVYQDNLKRFQAGRVHANDLALDQTRLFDSELFAVQGWSAAHQAFARLCHAGGYTLAECR
jgi:outer membrane protein TolC